MTYIPFFKQTTDSANTQKYTLAIFYYFTIQNNTYNKFRAWSQAKQVTCMICIFLPLL